MPAGAEMDAGARAHADAASTSAPRPLTEAQAGLWYAQRLDPDNPVFSTAQYVEIHGSFDRTAFDDAVRQAMDEADALAIRVIDEGDVPQFVVDARHRARLRQIDLRGEPDPLATAQAAMRADLAQPLDPTRDPLAAQWLFLLDDARHIWYQRVHHLVIDGFGTALLTARICDLYSSRVGDTPRVTTPFGSFDALLDADRDYRASPRRATDRDYWRAAFEQAPEAAGLAPGVALTDRHYHRHALDLPAGTGAALRALEASADVSWPDILTALVAAYLGRHVGGADVTVGVATMERMGTPAARVPAMVMNILPVRVPLDEARPLGEWLGDVSTRVRRARRHGRYRSEQLRRDLGLLGAERRLYGPLVNVLPFDEPPRLHGVSAQLHVLATGPVDDVTVTVRASAGLDRLRAELDANPRLYREEDVAAHTARLAAFIARSLEAARLADVPTLTDNEHTRWVTQVNDTAYAVEETTLDALIARTTARTPGATALVFGPRELSYAELDTATARLGDRLLAHGVRRGDVVGVALPRSIALVVALHAVVRIGAAYLPLDVDQPAERLSRVLRSAQPRIVVIDAASAPRLPEGTPRLRVDKLSGAGAEADAEASAVAGDARSRPVLEPPRPHDAAYVIYTSGSTGEPKGVVIEHRAIVNRLEWMRTHYGVAPADRILQKTPATFDVSVWEFFLPFLAGAALVVAPPDAHKDPQQLAALIADQRISIAHFVPSMLAEFLAEPGAARTSMRAVFCSGEALPAALRDRFHQRLRAELHNLYGPTEAAVDVTFWPASADDVSDPVPIGWPVWNTQLHVLDDRDRPVPPGVAGHLCLAGVQLARGYLGRPDLTAERFVTNPFGAPGSRMYRTGDLARWRADGAVEFLGRSDHQVKVRGQRIELGEIEAAFTATGLVQRVLVIAREAAPGDVRLVAYVQAAVQAASSGSATAQPVGADATASATASANASANADAHADADATLLRLVAERLPDVMVPSAIVRVDAWPTTSNGKVDLQRLPAPMQRASVGRAPQTPGEQRLAALFAETLSLDEQAISAEADFFTLGGHSLLAAQLIRRVRAAWGREIGLGVIFTHATVARLAGYLDRLADAAPSSATAVDAADEGLQPIVHLQRAAGERPAFVCIHPAGGISWCYGHLARALDPARTVLGLQAPALRPGAPLAATLDDLAADYVARLRQLQPDGPYHLGGWSVGGIIAQAMAAQLEAAGAEVGVLALLDAYPSDRWRSAAEADEAAALRALLLMAGEDPDAPGATAGAATGTVADANTFVRSRDSVIRRLRAGGHPLGALSDEALSGVLRVVAQNNRLVRRHQHVRCAAGILHFKAALDHSAEICSAEEWRPYVSHIETHAIPAVHAHMTGPAASRLVAAILARSMYP